MNVIKTIIISALSSTLISTGIQLFFENRRFKIERRSNLDKEIYFRKINAWERISAQMTLIHTEMRQYVEALSGPVFIADLNVTMNERIKELSILEVWFSQEVKDSWNKINAPYNIVHQTYLSAHNGNAITKEQGDKCIDAINDFNEAVNSLKEKIREELREEKEKIV